MSCVFAGLEGAMDRGILGWVTGLPRHNLTAACGDQVTPQPPQQSHEPHQSCQGQLLWGVMMDTPTTHKSRNPSRPAEIVLKVTP